MADFESIIKNHASEDGSIPSDAIGKLAKAISTAVGNEFVDKSRYKAKLEEIDELTGKLQTAEDSVTTADKWKTKYTALKEDFTKYKADQSAKETYAAKEKAYRAILKAANINEKRYGTVLRSAKADGIIDGIELDENGGAKDAGKLTEAAKTDWADFVLTTETTGAVISRPPTNTGGITMTRDEIFDTYGNDPAKCQEVIAANIDQFIRRE